MSGVQGSGVDLYARSRLLLRLNNISTTQNLYKAAALPSGFISLVDGTGFLVEGVLGVAQTQSICYLDIGDGVNRAMYDMFLTPMQPYTLATFASSAVFEAYYDASSNAFRCQVPPNSLIAALVAQGKSEALLAAAIDATTKANAAQAAAIAAAAIDATTKANAAQAAAIAAHDTIFTVWQTPLLGSGVNITEAHGMAAAPKAAWLEIECITAEQNWAVGDRIILQEQWDGAREYAIPIWMSATQVGAAIGAASVPLLRNKTNASGGVAPTLANWKYRFGLTQ